ncbi:MAG: DUF1848 domain-containing protein [Deltaproteobacteria bacterium]|nr:DUF1848 domain-containing protein [Deltaproteobacteria bacterium]
MESAVKIVISASRRTDIPAFYMKWFMKQIKNGRFEVVNPYNRHVSIVPATPDKVHTILFWSKNFGPFIKSGCGEKLREMGYNVFFNFTINSEEPLLEPNVPALEERIRQLEYLCRNFDSGSISWRFDPICFYKTKDGKIHDNLNDFNYISSKASKYGIKRCITSFMDDYQKIRKRIAKIPGFAFIDPPIEIKSEIVLKMKDELSDKNISLHTCCEKELLSILPENSGITKSSCIPNDLLMKLFGGSLSLKKDSGQRTKNGCGCKVSADVGSYSLHPCYHNCLFCYANPALSTNYA